MSRDWRPFEAVIADENAYMIRKEYIHDSKVTFHLRSGDKGIPMWNDKARKEFPNLCYLLDHFETKTYKELNDTSRPVYQEIEEQVGRLADHVRKQIKNNARNFSLYEVADTVPKTVFDWFEGELDINFYYNEENNALFKEYIDNLIRERSGKTYDIGEDEQWHIIHDCDDLNGDPTLWSRTLDDGSYLYIECGEVGDFYVYNTPDVSLPPLVDPDSGSQARFLSIEDAKTWVDETYLPYMNKEREGEER